VGTEYLSPPKQKNTYLASHVRLKPTFNARKVDSAHMTSDVMPSPGPGRGNSLSISYGLSFGSLHTLSKDNKPLLAPKARTVTAEDTHWVHSLDREAQCGWVHAG